MDLVQHTLKYVVFLIVWPWGMAFSPIAMYWSILGLQRPRSNEYCTVTDLPENGCSLSSGLDVSMWPTHSKQMFFLYYSTCDAILNVDMLRRKPFIEYRYADYAKFYTIMILDRDSHGLDRGEYYLHYLACNVEGYYLQKGLTWDERVLIRYLPPDPPKVDGYHRYLVVVYLQTIYLPDDMPNVIQSRNYFNIRLWMRKQPISFCGPLTSVQMRLNYISEFKSMNYSEYGT